MDYWSILASAILGAIGGGLGYFLIFEYFENREFASVGAVIVAILFSYFLKPIVYDDYIKSLTIESDIKDRLKNVEQYHLRRLPRMVDDITRQDSIKATEVGLKYEYTIMDPMANKGVFEKNFEQVKRSVRAKQCRDESSRFMISHHVVFEYVYKVQNSPNMYTFKVRDCDILVD